MKKITTLFTSLLFVSAVIVSNQVSAQSCPWAKKAGSINEDYGQAVATDASGNVYYLGNFFSQTITFGATTLHNQPYQASNYGSEMFLVKYDSCGTLIWAKQAGGPADTYGTALKTDATGNIYVTGFFQADSVNFGAIKLYTTAYRDIFLVKYNSSGIAQWAKQGTGNDQDMANGIALDASNNIYLTGDFASTSLTFGSNSASNGTHDGFTRDVFVAKFDNSGNNLWVRSSTSNTVTSGDALAYAIDVDAAGNAYVGGKFGSTYIRFGTDSVLNAGYNDLFIVKYNTSGTEQWLKGAGNSNDDGVTSLVADAAGNFYVTGYVGAGSPVSFGTNSISDIGTNRRNFVAKYDANGNNIWARIGKGDYYSNNYANSIAMDAAGSVYVTGAYSSDSLRMGAVTLFNTSLNNGSGGGDMFYDIFVAKYKSNGNLSWARTAGGDSSDMGNGITSGLNNSLYLTGEFLSPTISLSGITYSLTVGSLAKDGDAFICNNISTLQITPDICLVSADSINPTNEYNVMYWDKTPYTTISKFIFYREVTSGIYKKIGSQPFSALSRFIDTARSIGPANGNPFVGTYRYKLQLVDTAGTYSYLSPYHNTVYFQNNSGTFNWNLYSVENATITPVSTFDLVRDDVGGTGAWHVIGSIAGTQTSLTDPSYATFQATGDWCVWANGFSCTPTLRLGNNSNQTAIVKSKSNITNNRGIGVQQINAVANEVLIYPNPSGNFVMIRSTKELGTIVIYNTLGEIVFQQHTSQNELQTDISKLPAGIYSVQTQGKVTRLVKE